MSFMPFGGNCAQMLEHIPLASREHLGPILPLWTSLPVSSTAAIAVVPIKEPSQLKGGRYLLLY